MKYKKKLALFVGVIGIVLIILGAAFISLNANNNDTDTNVNNDVNSDEEIIESGEEVESLTFEDYDYAYNTAVDLYGGDDKEVTLTDNGDSYLITVKDKNGNILNTFEMSKEDGTISEIPIESEVTESIE